MLGCPERFSSSGLVSVREQRRRAGVGEAVPAGGGVEGAAGSLAGDVFADWGTIPSTSNPGGYGPSESNPALRHVQPCVLSLQARHPRAPWRLRGSHRRQV